MWLNIRKKHSIWITHDNNEGEKIRRENPISKALDANETGKWFIHMKVRNKLLPTFFCERFAGANGIHHSYKYNSSISGRVLINGRNFRLRIYIHILWSTKNKNKKKMSTEWDESRMVVWTMGKYFWKKNYLRFMWLLYIRVVKVFKVIQRYFCCDLKQWWFDALIKAKKNSISGIFMLLRMEKLANALKSSQRKGRALAIECLLYNFVYLKRFVLCELHQKLYSK